MCERAHSQLTKESGKQEIRLFVDSRVKFDQEINLISTQITQLCLCNTDN